MDADRYFNLLDGSSAIAVKLTQDNFKVVQEFLTARVKEDNKKLILQTPLGERVARVGQICVRNDKGQVWVARPENFYKIYQKIG